MTSHEEVTEVADDLANTRLYSDDSEVAEAPVSAQADGKKPKKKKKKVKQKAPLDEQDDDWKALESAEVLNPKAPNQCFAQGCKTSLGAIGMECRWCGHKYCIQHRLPESHSSQCASKAQSHSQSQFKQDSLHYVTESRKDQHKVNSNKFDISTSREELRKRLRDRIAQAKR
ncbi:hypothetical protein BZG36_00859 [Bifiguratus adelaidae]|uniref:AN1-type domain-containing protein n=1 Tax=Bifiguratus adelaidae TaxID=1938954 RepID=A0A261Y5B6_9FUNG|nr:hypothetical protein BZG36_00859 [Bifiguratus adelaidae]